MDIGLALSNEERNLYNPAYVGTILYHAIRECQSKNGVGLHCTLVYLIAPLAISSRFSSSLPSSVATPLAGWVAENEGVLVGFGDSVSSYIDVVNSAIAFLLEMNAIFLDDNGYYQIAIDHLPKLPAMVSKNNSFKRAFLSGGFLGRWFSEASSIENVYTHFGVMP